ncbi:MAG: hypothetical protein BWY31_01879 [Lentisphaerae bacterium ADurb.Bin242]|nr:MAG: hypothetical protein BWY31_01879 [Lentisphaerae bacterium ADurb.Bin242]
MVTGVVREKSYSFALRIVKMYWHLTSAKREFLLAGQVLRSGTSIGANVEEANGAQSSKDFLSKITIAYKEARETHYWLRLLRDAGYLDEKSGDSILVDCEELLRLLGRIKITTRSRLKPQPPE